MTLSTLSALPGEANSMRSDGHLFLSARGGVDAPAELRWWWDAAHGALLLLDARARRLRLVALDAALDRVDAASGRLSEDAEEPTGPRARATELYRFGERPSELPPIENVRVSIDGQLVAFQTSDIEVQVVHRATRETYWVLCKAKGGNRILSDGIVWSTHATAPTSSQDLFLVTKRGIEQYRVSSKRRNCRLHRTIGVQIHAHWYEPSHSVLLVSAGKRGNEIVPFLLRGVSVEKLPQLVFSSPILQQDLFLASMYGTPYAVYSDMRTSKLLLYAISRTKVACVRSLNLMLPPGTALKMSVVDNLLVCHSLDFNVSLLFDVRCEGAVNDPFSAPLPISMHPPGWNDKDWVHEPLVISHSNGSIGGVFDKALNDGHDTMDSGAKDENEDANLFDQQVHDLRRALSANNLGALSPTESAAEDEFVPPPPMSTPLQQSSSHSLPRSMTVDEMTIKSSKHHVHHRTVKSPVDQSLFSRWKFFNPNLVQRVVTSGANKINDPSSCDERLQVRKLQVNLVEICRSAAHHPEILSFLLRRGDEQLAKQLALGLVRDHVVEQLPSLASINALLDCVQTLTAADVEKSLNQSGESAENLGYGSSIGNVEDIDNMSTDSSIASSPSSFGRIGSSGSDPSLEVSRPVSSTNGDVNPSANSARNAQGFICITQADFFRYLWFPLLQDSSAAKTGNISLYINEYVKNLRRNSVPVESITYIALAQSFIEAGEPHKLYQYLHYHVLSDSRDLADALVRHGADFPSLLQVGLDMYFRLGAINALVYTLLDIGETDRAISISWRNLTMKEHNSSAIPAAVFFDACVRSLMSVTPEVSRFYTSQKLNNLLLFLQVWDPDALKPSRTSGPSRLAQTVSVPFPDHLVSPKFIGRLRSSFGFENQESRTT